MSVARTSALPSQAWRNPVIMQAICRYASPSTLVSLMRTDQRAFEAA